MIKGFIYFLIVSAVFIYIGLYETRRQSYDRGYDKGLEDGIRMTNEVLAEVKE